MPTPCCTCGSASYTRTTGLGTSDYPPDSLCVSLPSTHVSTHAPSPPPLNHLPSPISRENLNPPPLIPPGQRLKPILGSFHPPPPHTTSRQLQDLNTSLCQQASSIKARSNIATWKLRLSVQTPGTTHCAISCHVHVVVPKGYDCFRHFSIPFWTKKGCQWSNNACFVLQRVWASGYELPYSYCLTRAFLSTVFATLHWVESDCLHDHHAHIEI